MSAFSKLVVSCLAAVLLSVGFAPPSVAGTYYESAGGTDISGSTTLYYTRAHGDLNLRLTVGRDTTATYANVGYTIRMFDRSGRQVYSKSLDIWTRAGSETRTWRLGGNVTKVTIVRKVSSYYYTTWRTTRA